MIKKLTAVTLVLIMALCLFSACGENKTEADKLNIVCTVFPYYDWVRNIIGDSDTAEITLLLDSGTDLHSYQPTAADIITITSADIFIFTGGTSDSWVDDVLSTSGDTDTKIIDLMSLISEDKLYCVEAIGEDEHHHDEGEEHNHTHDEHIWLSLKNAVILTDEITKALCEKDSENKAIYEENCRAYTEKLTELDKNFADGLSGLSKDTVIFADRFPFIYLIKDYNLNYHAAFSGCSAESEASFETVKHLADKTDELGISCILITETGDGSVARTVNESTKNKSCEILTMNAMQSVTKDKTDFSYIEIMEENLKTLEKALS